jgi:hypothetical protein
MTDTPAQPELPPALRFLKWLVIVLMITMIGGVITIVGLLVTRMPDGRIPALPASLALPAGTEAMAITQGPGWIGVTTKDGRILIFSAKGDLVQEIAVTLPTAP